MMTKTYRNTETIQAEQFDGSEEMVTKYDLIKVPWYDEFFVETLLGYMQVSVGDWLATGADGEHWVIDDTIFRKTYEEVSDDE